MCSSEKSRGTSQVLGFTYPKYHGSSLPAYVDFYAYDPAEGKSKRKKYMIGGKLTKRERDRRGAELCAAITQKLSTGWNPWANASLNNSYTTLQTAIETYERHIEKQMRRKTLFSYRSRIKVLCEYISTLAIPPMYAYQFDSALVGGFLDYVYVTRDVCPRTRNNYLGWLVTFSEFMLSRKWITENPTAGFKKLREDEKRRVAIPEDELRRGFALIKSEDPHFYLAVLMEYFCFIRPTELSWAKIEHINLTDQTITIPATVSKNHKTGSVSLNPEVIHAMLDVELFNNPGSDYIFGPAFKPSAERRGPDAFNKRWKYFRKKLGWPDSYQFYSLKDSGIRDLANAAGVVNARDQARHSDVTTTNKYLSSSRGHAPEAAKHFRGALAEEPTR